MSVYNIPPSCGDRNEFRSTLRLPAATEMNVGLQHSAFLR